MLPIFLLKLSADLHENIRAMYVDAVKKHNDMVLNDPHPNAGFDLFLPYGDLTKKDELLQIDLLVSGAMTDGDGGYLAYTLESRSSISKSPLRMANKRGIIDTGYRGNLIACCDCIRNGEIHSGNRYFQVLHPSLEAFGINIVDDLDVTTRGSGGIGSTGGFHAGPDTIL